MALNLYIFSFLGSTYADGTGSPITVDLWINGPEDRVESLGEDAKFAGAVSNDSGLWGYAWKFVVTPFSLTAGGNETNDNARYLQFLRVAASRYKHITAVSGPDIIGSDGATQFWDQLLARFSDKIPIRINGISSSLDYDNNRWLTIEAACRYPGIDL